ncbi:unnamed protein product [Paramecium octaurelia]|uniref:Uncharacterized protein n=1 Tax=Paramecium octaurelia TaxID=43137 RepID=A0A8S1X6M7_PAROT|nr:unnamed protein product [Paramecium octaurelia]
MIQESMIPLDKSKKCNACWVVLGDVNERVEKMQKYLDEQMEKKKSGGLLQKAASYIKAS